MEGARVSQDVCSTLGTKFQSKRKDRSSFLFPHLPVKCEMRLKVFPTWFKERQESHEQGKAGKRSPQSTSPSQRNPAWDLAKPKLLFAIQTEINYRVRRSKRKPRKKENDAGEIEIKHEKSGCTTPSPSRQIPPCSWGCIESSQPQTSPQQSPRGAGTGAKSPACPPERGCSARGDTHAVREALNRADGGMWR